MDWYILEEIQWIYLENHENSIIDWEDIDNTWKQIYIPEKIDWLTLKIWWNIEESYDLMIAWWDYYTIIENVQTNSWQIDIFMISRENIQIDFDDNKIWNYNKSINLPPIYQDITSPTTLYSFSWELLSNSTWATYIQTVTIDLNSVDNEWWTWVNNIYWNIIFFYF